METNETRELKFNASVLVAIHPRFATRDRVFESPFPPAGSQPNSALVLFD